MIYPNFPLSDINLSELVLVKEVVKKYGQKDGSRWIFRAPGWLKIANSGDLFIKIWNSTYYRQDNILRGIETGFYDQTTTPALIGVITQNGLCRGYIQRRCSYHGKIEPEFHLLIQAKTYQTGLFLLQYSRYHIMRYKKQFSLIDLEGIYPLQELPSIPAYGTFEDFEYGNYVYKLYCDRYPVHGLELSDLIPQSILRNAYSSSLNRVVQLPGRKVMAGLNLMKKWLRSRRGIRKNRVSLIET